MVSFKTYLKENEDLLAKIMDEIEELSDEELETFGEVLYYEFFDDEETDVDDYDFFNKDDVIAMIKELGPEMYEDIYDMLEEIEDEEEEDDDDDDEDSEMDEGVTRRMLNKNFNRKKRKFMKNTKADLRKTKAARKKDARQSRADRKRYYRANKAKIAAYQKSRADAIKKGKHKVKKRRTA